MLVLISMISVGMSTTCVYPLDTEQSFRLASVAGFDGVELMVTSDPATRSIDAILALAARYDLPVLSVHAPVLLMSQLAWGRDARVKLEKSAQLARALGAPTVVSHPPFRWQRRLAAEFVAVVGEIAESTGIQIAVENMFPWRIAGRGLNVYAPSWDPSLDAYDAMTLDFSHASLSGRDSLELARAMGARLRHVHLCDGSGRAGGFLDEHLIPGRGAEPVAEMLALLASSGFHGSLIAEINTRRSPSEADRLARLRETVAFARRHLTSIAG